MVTGCRTRCPTDLQHLCCKALINKTKIFLLSMKMRISWYIRYFNSSLPSLLTEVIKTHIKLFTVYVMRVFYSMYFYKLCKQIVLSHKSGAILSFDAVFLAIDY